LSFFRIATRVVLQGNDGRCARSRSPVVSPAVSFGERCAPTPTCRCRQKRKGFGWKRWSRSWLYGELGLPDIGFRNCRWRRKGGTSLAVETEPGVGLHSGQRWAQACRRASCFPLSGRIVFGFDQRGAVGLAFDLEDDRLFDQAVEKGHRQRAINQILSPFVEVHVGHQRGGALLVA